MNCLLTDPILKTVSGLAGTFSSRFARPYPSALMSFPILDHRQRDARNMLFQHLGFEVVVDLSARTATAAVSNEQQPEEGMTLEVMAFLFSLSRVRSLCQIASSSF
jgi:hypothetical protein